MMEEVVIRIILEGEDAQKFEAVKRYLGLKSNTEVIRFLVSSKYHEIEKKPPRCLRKEVA